MMALDENKVRDNYDDKDDVNVDYDTEVNQA